MIGYLSGKYLGADDGAVLVDVGGVGYSVLVPAKLSSGLASGAPVEFYVHTNLRENALELFGFASAWEKRVFQALTGVQGIGPRTGLAVLGALDPATVLSAIVREDRATLTRIPGIGKKTAERLILDLAEKARKLMAERPAVGAPASAVAGSRAGGPAAATRKGVPAQGASASPNLSQGYSEDIAELWNEALAALVNLGYREGDAIAAIKMASAKAQAAGAAVSLEKLIMSSLQLMSRGLG